MDVNMVLILYRARIDARGISGHDSGDPDAR
jgi:hypothetical protein